MVEEESKDDDEVAKTDHGGWWLVEEGWWVDWWAVREITALQEVSVRIKYVVQAEDGEEVLAFLWHDIKAQAESGLFSTAFLTRTKKCVLFFFWKKSISP